MFLSKRVALAIAGVAAAAVVGTAGVAAATAPTSSGSPSPTAAPTSPGPANGGPMHRRGMHRGWMRIGALHGEFVVKGKDGGYVTLVTVRGQVTAVSASSITIKAEDGFTATYAVNSDTKVRGRVQKITDVKVGDHGGAVGTKTGSTVTARAVLVRR